MDVAILIFGLALIVFGANLFVDGASALASRFGISDFMIGLTVVAIGTSLPELVISVLSALKGSSDIAIGNVVGSNMVNTLVIIGITALIRPIVLSKANMRKDIPFMILASLVLLIVISDEFLDGSPDTYISRSEGMLLLGFFLIFLAYSIFSDAGTAVSSMAEKRKMVIARRKNIFLVILMIAGGIFGLVWGADLFLDSAVSLARRMGVSEAVIGVTLVAVGTSVPELATSITAAVKGNTGMALGNIIGSNIFNIFLVLGTTAVVKPLTLGGILPGDAIAVVAAAVLLFFSAFAFKKNMLDRADGIVFLLLYGGYVAWLLLR